MKRRPGLIVTAGMLAMAATSWASMRDQPEVFFKPGPEAPSELAADRLYPQGRLFPFSLLPVKIAKSAEDQRLGVVLLSADPPEPESPKIGYRVGLDRTEGSIVFADPQKLRDQIGAQITAAFKEPGIAFWCLKPDGIQIKEKREKEYLMTASRAIAQHDPLQRPVWMMLPPEGKTAYLSQIAPWVGYLGKTWTVDDLAMRKSRIWFRWAVERAVEAIYETDAPAIAVAVPVSPVAVSADEVRRFPLTVRHDLYLSLVTGAKGILSAPSRQEPEAGVLEAFQEAMMGVARELLGPKKLGELFLYAERRDELEIDIVEGPSEVEVLYPEGGVTEPMAYRSVSHLDLAYGKDRYLVLVNSALEPVTLMVGGMPYTAVRAESLLKSHPLIDVAEGEFETDLQPLEVRIYRLTRQ